MDGTADHCSATDCVKKTEGVKSPRSYAKRSEKDVIIDTASPVGDSEKGDDDDAGGNWSAFVISDLSGSVRERGCRYVEACQPTDSADHKVSQDQSIPETL